MKTLLFGKYCKKCGLSSSYADDSNFTIRGKIDFILLSKINYVLDKWVNYCNKNKLVINEDKTMLCRITSRQQHQANPPEQVILDQLDEDGNNIRPKEVVRILGVNIS